MKVLGHDATALVDPETVVLAEVDKADGLGVVQQRLQEVGEALLERRGALHFVEHAELGRQLRLDRELIEQSACKRMKCADWRLIEVVEREGCVSAVGPTRSCFQCASNLVAQLGGSLLGEGDGRDTNNGYAAQDQVDDALYEGRRFAAAGSCLYEQRGVERAADKVAVGLVRCRRKGIR